MDVAENFPVECRYVLEQLGEVYRIDAVARKTGLNPQGRLQLHQEQSKPIMEGLHKWLEAQLAERDGAELGTGASDSLSAAALAIADSVSTTGRGTIGQ